MKNNVVKVVLWGQTVGYIYWDDKKNYSVFEYDKEFVHRGLDIAPLTMPRDSIRSQKGLPWLGDKDKLYQGLPPMIADSLPDRWGNSIFNAWMKRHKIKASDITPIDKLSFTGSRAMGALEYEPAQPLGAEESFDVDVVGLYDFAKEVLDERTNITLTHADSILWQDLIKVGGSAGGRRPKAVVAINHLTGEIKSGQANAPEGFKHCLLKYDDAGDYPYSKIEYIYYRMAVDAGIEMMLSRLQINGDNTYFITERFDRAGNDKIHTQTLAAMAPTANSYEDIFAVIRQLNLPYRASEQQFLRMAFNVFSRNVDDHNKNFSFCMNRQGVWSLSPAYDLTYSIDQSAPAYQNRQSLFVNGKDADITTKDLLEVAKHNDISAPLQHIERVRESLSKFAALAGEYDIQSSLVKNIEESFSRE